MGELLSEIGDLVFSLVIGYIGAIEFLYVVRHLYHWSFNHEATENINDDERLAHLQDSMRQQLETAKSNEDKAGTKVMRDGVQYKDGFRIEPTQAKINELKEQLNEKALNYIKRQELETELAKLQKVAEQTRKELEQAEATRRKEGEEENSGKLVEAEQKREREQRKLEEEQTRNEVEESVQQLQAAAEENARKLEKAEKQRKQEKEEIARKEAEKNARQLLEVEKLREAEQRRNEEEQTQREAEENARKLEEAEKQREHEQRRKEEEAEAEESARQLMQAEKQREAEQRRIEEGQVQREAEENHRKLAEKEKQRELDQRRKEEEIQALQETEENASQLMEAEKLREAEKRWNEEEQTQSEPEENESILEESEKQQEEEQQEQRKLQEAEKQREEEKARRQNEENYLKLEEENQEEEEEKLEQEENSRRLAGMERANEDKLAAEENERLILEAERQEQEEENAIKYLEIEHKLEEQLRAAEQEADLTEKERQLIESIKRRDISEEDHNEQKEEELLRRILEAREQLAEDSEEEQSLRLIEREQDHEAKQRRIEENALLFLEAEKEMAEIQQQMQEAVDKRMYASNLESAPQTPILEEPCIKKLIAPLLDEEPSKPVNQRVKTQLAQDLNESYTVSTKPLLFPGLSDEGSSVEPPSSYQSSFSTQPSEDVTTGTDLQYPPQQERQEPDGEDTTPSKQYSEDYLRSLDGIKQRPLIRDGSGRRRAFKKRRSSNSSNSSRESRTSRDEELKMFTSLEEEEMKTTDNSEFTPIRYTSEPTLKVKGHQRRHKRSPAKDMKSDDSLRLSLERLGEETNNPWGEVQPEHFKNTDFWQREKAVSIDEEMEMEYEKPTSSEEITYDIATNMPSASSFEEATQIQNEQALTALHKQASEEPRNEELDEKATLITDELDRSDNKTNLQISLQTEKEASPTRSSTSPSLRRSPRMEKMDKFDKHLKENHVEKTSPSRTSPINTPLITVQSPPDLGSWRDEHGLMIEGLSDFYDFSASVNPSRSQNNSRNPSPANSAPNTPLPKEISLDLKISDSEHSLENTVEIYDDTGDFEKNVFKKENIIKFIDSLNGTKPNIEEVEYELSTELSGNSLQHEIKYVMEDLSKRSENCNSKSGLLPMVNIIEDSSLSDRNENYNQDAMNSLVASLRTKRVDGSRSRSKSPLPTPANLQRSLENRRDKMIRHNEDILEKLIESNLLPETPTTIEEIMELEASSAESTNFFVDTIGTQRSSSNSRRSRSPLPSATNIERSLEHRRNKRIQENDELFEKHNSIPSQSQSMVAFNASSTDGDRMSSSQKGEILSLEQPLKVDQQRSRSKSPMRLPSAENFMNSIDSRRHKLIERNDEIQKQIDERAHTPETPNLPMELVYKLENISEISEKIQQSTLTNSQISLILQAPTISVEFDNTVEVTSPTVGENNDDCSRENMDLLVESLRVARTRSRTPVHRRSRSESPLHFSSPNVFQKQQEDRRNTPETPNITVEYIYEFDGTEERYSEIPEEYVYDFESPKYPEPDVRSRHSRSNTPSRSYSLSPSHETSPSPNKHSERNDFHVMLNLEGSINKTLSKNSEELESLKLYCQRQLDEEALEQLKNASEEMELRTLSPLILDHEELNEKQGMDFLADLPVTERVKILRKSPTTPDYERTFSEEMQDVERIKKETLENRFKRSTYVGESLDIGSEYEPLRREAAQFQRSHSPSPSFSRTDIETAHLKPEEKRKIQDMILAELMGSSNEASESRKTGAIPKTEKITFTESELSLSTEMAGNLGIMEEIFGRGTHIEGESADISLKYEEMRLRNAEFRRSASKSRSPLKEAQLKELVEIDKESAKRELQDKILDEISNYSMSFQEFSKHLNPDFLDNDRRASDSALIQKPDVLLQFQNNSNDPSMDMEPDEYHHCRRFSLAQELPVEEYPNDDYIFIEQIEVRTSNGARTWVTEELYSEDVNGFLRRQDETLSKFDKNTESLNSPEFLISKKYSNHSLSYTEENPEKDLAQEDRESYDNMEENLQQEDADDLVHDDEEYSNNSDDDRETVVEVDDEIDEDISDFKADESHHEISECEEADREMDRYADREASDWNEVQNFQDENQGAVGGSTPYDSDSFAIDQIYDEAIKNRKQSGILREFDSILMQISTSDIDEQYAPTKKKQNNLEFNVNFLDNERKDTEMRYLGNAKATERQSLRLRSRYGYNPILQTNRDDGSEVDLNYIPKREYNWRKNFKLDEIEEPYEQNQAYETDEQLRRACEESVENSETTSAANVHKNIVGDESITLFSRSPERTTLEEDFADNADNEDVQQNSQAFKEVNLCNETKDQKLDKPKKKKTKKKSHKESRECLELVNKDEEDVPDSYIYNRRSSSIQMETDSPKRKSRSRRSSKSSIANDDSLSLFSPRSSVGYAEPIADIIEEYTETVQETVRPKKIKKRKKVKETTTDITESPTENRDEKLYFVEPISAIITPGSSNANILSTLSPTNSVCVTPASIDLELNGNVEEDNKNNVTENLSTASNAEATPSSTASTISTSRTYTITSAVDSFDILKDANFYPLF